MRRNTASIIGGPIIKDKVHFFVAYEGKEFNTPTTVVPGLIGGGYDTQLPADAGAQLGPASLPFKENDWFGKIDCEPTDRDRFELSAQIPQRDPGLGYRRRHHALGGHQDRATPTSATTCAGITAPIYWFNRLQVTYEDAFYAPTPATLRRRCAAIRLGPIRTRPSCKPATRPLARRTRARRVRRCRTT